MMLNREKINNMLRRLIHEFQILDGHDLGIFFKDDSGNNNYRAIYLWIEELMDQNPDISFDEVRDKYLKQLPAFLFD